MWADDDYAPLRLRRGRHWQQRTAQKCSDKNSLPHKTLLISVDAPPDPVIDARRGRGVKKERAIS